MARENRKTTSVHSYKAFSGELVETEVKIERRKGRDYETAEVLIERIKEERGKGEKKR